MEDLLVFGQRLDSMILEISSNLDDSVITKTTYGIVCYSSLQENIFIWKDKNNRMCAIIMFVAFIF